MAAAGGGGWWRLRYWLESRENRLSLGTDPEVGLADARDRRDAARKLIAAGTDPRAAVALSALLLLRPGKPRHMEWAWIDFDSAALTVPGEVMKRTKADKASGPAHVVSLAQQSAVILRELHPLTGQGRYVFPSLLTGERCMSENTVRGALRRMGYASEEMTAHGFRAMARAMIAERLGIAPQ